MIIVALHRPAVGVRNNYKHTRIIDNKCHNHKNNIILLQYSTKENESDEVYDPQSHSQSAHHDAHTYYYYRTRPSISISIIHHP